MKTSCTVSLLSNIKISPPSLQLQIILYHPWSYWRGLQHLKQTENQQVASLIPLPLRLTKQHVKKWNNVHSMYSRFHVCSYSNLPTSGEAATCRAACIYSRLPERSSMQDFMLWKRLEDHDGFRCQCKVTATDLNYSLHNPI